MPAEITSAVHLVTDLPDGAELRTEIGSITVAVHPDGVDLGEIRTMLGELLLDAGRYMVNSAPAPGPASPGEGESGSLG